MGDGLRGCKDGEEALPEQSFFLQGTIRGLLFCFILSYYLPPPPGGPSSTEKGTNGFFSNSHHSSILAVNLLFSHFPSRKNGWERNLCCF